MSDATTLTMLVPGSVWKREASGKHSIVLFISNQELSGKLAAKFPPQVVFMTEEKSVLSLGIDSFLGSRVFTTMEPRIEQLLTAITTPEDELGLDDEPEENEDPIEGLTALVDPDDEGEQDAGLPVIDDVGRRDLRVNFGPHPSAELLQANLVDYSESPWYTGDTLHTLRFALEDGLTLETIRSAFIPSDPNAIQKFVISTPYEDTMVDIESYGATLYSTDEYRQYGAVTLLTAGDFRTYDGEIEDIQVDDDAVIDTSSEEPASVTGLTQPQVTPITLTVNSVAG